MTNTKENKQVASYWAWVAKRGELGYWNIPGWQEHQNLLASGGPDRSWLDVFAEELRDHSKSRIALSLGCGSGWLEQILLEKEICYRAEACDLSTALVESAQKRATSLRLPINYFTEDLNHPSLPPRKYDVVAGAGIFHHIANLECLFENIVGSLKENGKLIIYDYVGPSRFQWTKEQMEFCNRWIDKLPKKYLKKRGYPWYYYVGKNLFDLFPFVQTKPLEKLCRKMLPGKFLSHFLRIKYAKLRLNKVEPPPPEHFLVTDPSEAIRSSDILPLINRFFHIEKFVPQGGTLAQPLFSRTVANFLLDHEGAHWAARILEDERQVIANGQLSSDLVALIARPK